MTEGMTARRNAVVGMSAFVLAAAGLLLVVRIPAGAQTSAVGLNWTSTDLVSPHTINAVSCPTTGFCVAANEGIGAGTGGVDVLQGGRWSKPITADPGQDLLAISCPTTSFCAATDDAGSAVTWDGHTWSARNDSNGTELLLAASGMTSTFCAALDCLGDPFQNTRA